MLRYTATGAKVTGPVYQGFKLNLSKRRKVINFGSLLMHGFDAAWAVPKNWFESKMEPNQSN